MKQLLSAIFLLILGYTQAQDWKGIPVAASPQEGTTWQLQEEVSDDFNYTFEATAGPSHFGEDRWYNFYHANWDGPGSTYWQHDCVSVKDGKLKLTNSRSQKTQKMGVPGVNAGCVTSLNRVKYPVYVESSVSIANITLASDVWLLSPDATQEIDIIECYGGQGQGNAYFAKYIHLSHHSFIRQPFTDYQPRDMNSWWKKPGVTAWGDYCWNGGERRYVRVAVNWISPFHFEYYVDGELVRVLFDKAFANKINDQWVYTYPTMTNGQLDMEDGRQKVIEHSKSENYSLPQLKATSEASEVSVIDPYNYQDGKGFYKAMDIIINMEAQDWHVAAGRCPSDEDLKDPTKNTMLVDWIRVYKAVKNTK